MNVKSDYYNLDIEKYLCSVCCNFMDDPAVLNCTHKACLDCAKELFENKMGCKTCEKPITEYKVDQITAQSTYTMKKLFKRYIQAEQESVKGDQKIIKIEQKNFNSSQPISRITNQSLTVKLPNGMYRGFGITWFENIDQAVSAGSKVKFKKEEICRWPFQEDRLMSYLGKKKGDELTDDDLTCEVVEVVDIVEVVKSTKLKLKTKD